MNAIIQGAGVFIYPLGIFSFLAMYVIVERLLALRTAKVIPQELTDAILSGAIVKNQGDLDSVAGRIVYFFRRTNPDPEALKSFARLEIAKLERGLFILEIVISGAPLLGLLGTITGLVQAFSSQALDQSMPNKGDFIHGISLALSTTMLGLCVAIPALVGNSYLCRRVDLLSIKLDMAVERLIDLDAKK